MKDLVHNIKAIAAYAGATISTSTDTDSAIIIDSQGYDSIAFLVYSGAITDGAYSLKIMEADNSDGTTGATEVGSYQVQGSFADTDDSVVKKVGAALTKRYCKLRITSSGTTSGGVFKGAIAVLGSALSRPVA